MVAANGMNLRTHESCDFDVIIEGCCYSIIAIVADLNTTGILGLGFLSEYEWHRFKADVHHAGWEKNKM